MTSPLSAQADMHFLFGSELHLLERSPAGLPCGTVLLELRLDGLLTKTAIGDAVCVVDRLLGLGDAEAELGGNVLRAVLGADEVGGRVEALERGASLLLVLVEEEPADLTRRLGVDHELEELGSDGSDDVLVILSPTVIHCVGVHGASLGTVHLLACLRETLVLGVLVGRDVGGRSLGCHDGIHSPCGGCGLRLGRVSLTKSDSKHYTTNI